MKQRADFHERFDRQEDVKVSSDRSFGIVMSGFSLMLMATGLYKGWGHPIFWGVAAIIFLCLSLIAPYILAPLNRSWLAFGIVLHRIANPLIMTLLFFGTILPIGFLRRLIGSDPLALTPDREAKSYWVKRIGESTADMRNQF